MKGIIISDSKDGFLTFDLVDILQIIGEKARLSTWKVFNVECVGKDAAILHYISDCEKSIPGDDLFYIFKPNSSY